MTGHPQKKETSINSNNQTSNTHYKKIIENIPQIIFTLDENGTITYINEAITPITGYTPQEIIGTNFIQHIPKEKQSEILADFKQSLINQPKSLTYKLYKKNGDIIWVSSNAKKVINKQGKKELHGILIDITEKRKTQQQLKISEKMLRKLLNNLNDGVAIYTPINNCQDFIFKDMNTKGQILSKVKKEEIIGKRVTQLFPGIKKMGLLKVFQEVYKTGKSQNHPTTLYKDNRITQWVENYVFKLPSGEIVAVYTDTTEEVKTRKQLEESEQRFREMAETINAIFWISSTDGKQIQYISPAFEKIYEYTKEDLKTKNWTDFIHEKDRDKILQTVKEKHGTHYQIEYRIKTKTGRIKWVRDTIYPTIDKNGETTKIIGFGEDITNTKKNQAEKEKLQQQLAEYAKKLEKKIKKLEKQKIDLTEKEKLVFYGITQNPNINDRQLANKLALKRSTVTSIKNRLKQRNYYSEIYIPNFEILDYKILTIISGKIKQNQNPKQIRNYLQQKRAYSIKATKQEYYAEFGSQNIIQAQYQMNELLKENRLEIPTIKHTIINKNETLKIMQFAKLLKKIFNIEQKITTPKTIQNTTFKLTKTIKEICYQLCKSPSDSTTQIAKKLRLTRATVANTKKKIIKKNIMTKIIKPNLKKLNCTSINVIHTKLKPGIPAEQTADQPNTVTNIRGINEQLTIHAFENAEAKQKFMHSNIKTHKQQQLLAEPQTTIDIPINQLLVDTTNFSEILAKEFKNAIYL